LHGRRRKAAAAKLQSGDRRVDSPKFKARAASSSVEKEQQPAGGQNCGDDQLGTLINVSKNHQHPPKQSAKPEKHQKRATRRRRVAPSMRQTTIREHMVVACRQDGNSGHLPTRYTFQSSAMTDNTGNVSRVASTRKRPLDDPAQSALSQAQKKSRRSLSLAPESASVVSPPTRRSVRSRRVFFF